MTILESITKISNASMDINKINSNNSNNINNNSNKIIQQLPFINIYEKSICTAIIPHNEIERKMPIFKRFC
ncbi:hypothetical protein DDB_G0286439 [Dictyostelium discoideum AX4]|uniref:Putative uncharacterized protein DDB_G0286439 n=1 Tax=Dictyostelium discoideum TaxID=44689 RepID=Y6982_DICDI|nr:hypothetical protein DDB_G0286439 [Dictyostelium discoideum AX4]Q54LS3.1 RecName: Full=Putative uncharacterized protein DDB_G0286439 [Dictyostelium discoideum]EAL64244.1 hypothetical protein DDB_G0286439 [Dictyostelium discoideum AX4]|eukprot:XP_637757.1 hypothetical protein DDB_G0286439 [Dictyostelium discoideum AX4]